MQSSAKTVTAYIEEAPEERRSYLNRLRDLCLEVLVDHEERMEYGMPVYQHNGVIQFGFASQKNYISLYVVKEDVMQENRTLLQGLSVGKGCIRYSNLKKMDFAVIQKLLEDTIRSDGVVC
jgi:uncharacterized protein YdhG (YjbR/CyaY superfamily)